MAVGRQVRHGMQVAISVMCRRKPVQQWIVERGANRSIHRYARMIIVAVVNRRISSRSINMWRTSRVCRAVYI